MTPSHDLIKKNTRQTKLDWLSYNLRCHICQIEAWTSWEISRHQIFFSGLSKGFMCHIKIGSLCNLLEIFNKNQVYSLEIYQEILSWSLTPQTWIWGNKGLKSFCDHDGTILQHESDIWDISIFFSTKTEANVMGNKERASLILTFLLGTIFTQVWRSNVTFFLMRQNQCLRPHRSANWSLSVGVRQEIYYLSLMIPWKYFLLPV